ncbi:uncharacterized protein ATNIH1004_007770 [Aspergillus tanneri]|uniref:Retroviral polymerase SH3-like domain-containing protein n=1 Tax=Aspergillus tanneri TaxID=1220188 RepID=A0A5M9MN25_9EURO|nr:uncharacterized protein ATNIH1004_007770 [Aspergillus tanneri]KAA8646343.1 hypothetical protein ATNIH1004_007770 [Aspergillus tanneri]
MILDCHISSGRTPRNTQGVSTNPDIQPSQHVIPHSAIFNEHPQIAHIHPFGCRVWYYNDPGHQDFNKIVGRGAPGVYIGSDSSTYHKIYVKETNKVIRTGHVSFNEQEREQAPRDQPMQKLHALNSTVPPNPNPEHLAQEALHLMGDSPAEDNEQSDWVRPAKNFDPFAGFTPTSTAEANRPLIPNTWQEAMKSVDKINV